MSDRARPRKVRLSPRMSAPKLGEYIDVVRPSRRESIIREQKFPAVFMMAYYKDAFNAIRASLRSGADVLEQLAHRATVLASRPALKKYDADVRTCCVQAIQAFGRIYPTLALAGWAATPAPELGVVIETVPVSVHPAVLLTRKVKGEIETGALLVVFRKDVALRDIGGKAVAELLRQAINGAGRPNVVGKMCLVVDVFSGQVFFSPRQNSRLKSDLHSACREIAVRWPEVA